MVARTTNYKATPWLTGVKYEMVMWQMESAGQDVEEARI
jgi:hypothetical protein